jgi:hypothetical protein
MTRHARSRRSATVAAAVATVAILAAPTAVPTAGAHGGDGNLEVVDLRPTPGMVEVTVRLTYVADGHDVEDATVTVAGEDATGSPLTPVVLQHDDGAGPGAYSGSVAVPAGGSVSLRVTSVAPSVQLALPSVEVPGAQAGDGGEPVADAPEVGGATAGTEDTMVTQQVPDPFAAAATATDADADDGNDGGAGPVIWLLVGLAVVVALGAGIWAVTRRQDGSID